MPEILDPQSKRVVALIGLPGAGKGAVSTILKGRGFRHIATGDMVREEAVRRGVGIEERYKLHEIANAIQSEGGPEALAKMVIEKIRASVENVWVVDGIRHPAQVAELKKKINALILGVTASREMLTERILGRKRTGDPKTPKEVSELLDREWDSGIATYGIQVAQCMPMADTIIENNGTLAELEEKVLALCDTIDTSA
ncbi:nucleoside monophosphate kinase [Candidatus Peregrinibacteria bacterium]|nr:nucleoside monophosphate kinase [Candidatus Peregrinibacteria bacterium]